MYMQDFLEKRAEAALENLLAHEKGPADLVCQECKSELPTGSSMYRCFDCYLPPTLCRECIVHTHRHNPFHFVQEWETQRRFWLRKPLTALDNLVFELGHGGHQCMYSTTPPRPMCIVSEHGIHNVRVRFCCCQNPSNDQATPESTQLLQHGFWPASWDKPHTAFTIRVLRDFNLLSTQANVTAYDFYKVMRRKTDNIAPHEVEVRECHARHSYSDGSDASWQDRYREFMTASRTFDHITELKRHGQKVREIVYASLAVLCPACPQPGENMDPKWHERAEGLKCSHTF